MKFKPCPNTTCVHFRRGTISFNYKTAEYLWLDDFKCLWCVRFDPEKAISFLRKKSNMKIGKKLVLYERIY
jgi:hypothetical protein